MLCNLLYSQNNTIHKDSIIEFIHLANNSTKQKRDSLLSKALKLAKQIDNDSLTFEIAADLASNGIRDDDSILYKKGVDVLLHQYKTKKDYKSYGYYYKFQGTYKSFYSSLDSAYYYFEKAKKVFKEHNYTTELSIVFEKILTIQLDLHDRIGLEKTAIEIFKFLENNSDYFLLSNTYQSQALSAESFDFEKAKKYFNKAIYYSDSIKDNYLRDLDQLYLRMATSYTYNDNEKYEEAAIEAQKGIDTYKKTKFKKNLKPNYYWLLHNLAISELELNKIQLGFAKLDTVLNYTIKTNDLYSKAFVVEDLAYYHNKHGNVKKALNYAEDALQITKQTKNTKLYMHILEILTEITNVNRSNKLLKELLHLKDSIYKKELKIKDQYALVKFETEQKEAENSKLKQEIKLNKVKLKNEHQRSNIIGLGALLSLLIAGFIYYIYTARKKEFTYKTNLEKAKAREQERIDIAANLHDKVVGDLRVIHKKTVTLNTDDISKPLHKVQQEIRNISHKLSSIDFDEISFKDQLINLVADYFEPKFRIKVTNIDTVDWSLINTQIKRTLFLVIRESIQNSKNHADATEVNVNFVEKNRTIQLQISDNGKGFDVQSPKLGIGLKSQKRRVEELNGIFTLESIINSGTTTKVNIPIIV